MGRLPIKTASQLVNIYRKSEVLLNETDVKKFLPALKQTLGRGKVLRQGADLVAEAKTESVVAANRFGWTDKLRAIFGGENATVEAGTKKLFCFPAGTLVHLGNGSLRPIEEIKVKDEVVSRDEKTQKNSVQKVTQLFRHIAKQTLRLRFSNGETVEATPEHPFFVSGKGFRPARVLAVGMAIATLGQSVKASRFWKFDPTWLK